MQMTRVRNRHGRKRRWIPDHVREGKGSALHDEDDVGPVQRLRRDRLVRVGGQAGGGRLHARPVGEDLLGGGGAEAVAGADGEEVGHSSQQ